MILFDTRRRLEGNTKTETLKRRRDGEMEKKTWRDGEMKRWREEEMER